jgi:hypothetical protein
MYSAKFLGLSRMKIINRKLRALNAFEMGDAKETRTKINGSSNFNILKISPPRSRQKDAMAL